jgi:hypothetical protein
MPIKIEELLKVVFYVGSTPRLYKEDPRPTELITERKWIVGS